jgi:hypothetical protein
MEMYEQMYEAMVSSNMAIKMENPVWLDKENNIVQSKEDAYNRQTKYFTTHPDYLIFVHGVGDNTSQ